MLFYQVLYRHSQFHLKFMTYLRILSPQTNEVDPGVLLTKVLRDVNREVLHVGKTRNPLGREETTKQAMLEFDAFMQAQEGAKPKGASVHRT